MRRSPQPRVRSEGEVLFEAQALRAQLVNLSRGGLCARGELPRRLTDSIEQRPEALRVALGLLDGRPPITAVAKLAWVRKPRTDDALQTFGLSFVDVSHDDRSRLEEAIAARVSADPQPAMVAHPQGEMRLRVINGPTLRVEADSIDDRGVLIGAELPWLRVGGRLEAEVDGVWRAARSSWVGLDVTPSGGARLRMRLEYDAEAARETTLPYFFTGHIGEQDVEAELDAIPDGKEVDWARQRLFADLVTATGVPEVEDGMTLRVSDESRGHDLVRIGSRRRLRLALLRASAGVAALGAMFWLGLKYGGGPAAFRRDIPAEVRPVARPAQPALVESERSPAIEGPEGQTPVPTEAAPPATELPVPAAPEAATPVTKAPPRPAAHPKKLLHKKR